MKKIILDVGNVIVKVDNNLFFKTLIEENHGDLLLCDQIVNDAMWSKLDQGLVSYTEACSYYQNRFSEQADLVAKLFELWPSAMQVHEPMVNLMKTLKAQGYPIYLLTNINQYCLDYLRQNLAFYQLADGCLASCECHLNKPSVEIYQCLETTFNLQAKDCLYLDDNVDNIDTANALGYDTILVTDIDEAINQVKEKLHA